MENKVDVPNYIAQFDTFFVDPPKKTKKLLYTVIVIMQSRKIPQKYSLQPGTKLTS